MNHALLVLTLSSRHAARAGISVAIIGLATAAGTVIAIIIAAIVVLATIAVIVVAIIVVAIVEPAITTTDMLIGPRWLAGRQARAYDQKEYTAIEHWHPRNHLQGS
jgi:hypothetical protein